MINYYLLTKPKIVMGNLVTVAAGFLLATHGLFFPSLFGYTMLGLALIMASACIFNNFIDRKVDQKMQRTKKRAFAMGRISVSKALFFATILALLGSLFLLKFTNLLTFLIAAGGFFVYVVLYSLWKCRTIYGTAIGSIAGAVPPLVGYVAVSNRLDLGALLLFIMMILWQMPHFFSIAIYHFDDYKAAKIPVLPCIKGITFAKKRMVLYIIGFMATTLLLTIAGYVGYIYFVGAFLLGLTWLFLALKGFKAQSDKLWARLMFRFSLITIITLSIMIPVDVL